MKTILATCVVAALWACVSEAKDKPVRFALGTVRVTRLWSEKRADGSFELKIDTPCLIKTKIPVYENLDNHVPDIPAVDYEIGECASATGKNEPIKIVVSSSLGISAFPSPSESQPKLQKVFSGSYTFASAPKAMAGGFSTFATKDVNLKNGTLLLVRQLPPGATIPTEEDTTFNVNVEFED